MGSLTFRNTLGILTVLAALVTVPAPAVAEACSESYQTCLNTWTDYVTSIEYHDEQCLVDYTLCVMRQILQI